MQYSIAFICERILAEAFSRLTLPLRIMVICYMWQNKASDINHDFPSSCTNLLIYANSKLPAIEIGNREALFRNSWILTVVYVSFGLFNGV